MLQLNTCEAPALSVTLVGVIAVLHAALSVTMWTFVSWMSPSFVSVHLNVTFWPATAISGLAVLGLAETVVDGLDVGNEPVAQSYNEAVSDCDARVFARKRAKHDSPVSAVMSAPPS